MNQQEEAFYIWEKNQHLSAEECWELAEIKITTNNISNKKIQSETKYSDFKKPIFIIDWFKKLYPQVFNNF